MTGKGPPRKRIEPTGGAAQLDAFQVAALAAQEAELRPRTRKRGQTRATERRTVAEILAAVAGDVDAEARARSTDPETAHIGAASVDLPPREYAVATLIAEHGALTTYEIANLLGRERQNVSSVPSRLKDMGLVEIGGYRIHPETGLPNIAWRLRTGDGLYCPGCDDGVFEPGLCRYCAKEAAKAERQATRRARHQERQHADR